MEKVNLWLHVSTLITSAQKQPSVLGNLEKAELLCLCTKTKHAKHQWHQWSDVSCMCEPRQTPPNHCCTRLWDYQFTPPWLLFPIWSLHLWIICFVSIAGRGYSLDLVTQGCEKGSKNWENKALGPNKPCQPEIFLLGHNAVTSRLTDHTHYAAPFPDIKISSCYLMLIFGATTGSDASLSIKLSPRSAGFKTDRLAVWSAPVCCSAALSSCL